MNISDDITSGLTKSLSNPQVLIEITSKCNFACGYCTSPFNARGKGHMSYELFERIAEQLPTITSQDIRMHVDGEPTLHPDFIPMVKKLNSLGMRAKLATNGSLLKSEMTSLKMDIFLSMSLNEDDLKYRHKKLSFDEYYQTVLSYLKSWLHTESTQNITLYVIYFSKQNAVNVEEEKRSKEAAIERIIDELNDSKLGVVNYKREGSGGGCVIEKNCGARLDFILAPVQTTGLFPENGKQAVHEQPSSGFCNSPWFRLTVLRDGRVGYCCLDLSGATTFTLPHEIENRGLKDIWLNHEKINEIRNGFLKGIIPNDTCAQCLAPLKDNIRICAIK